MVSKVHKLFRSTGNVAGGGKSEFRKVNLIRFFYCLIKREYLINEDAWTCSLYNSGRKRNGSEMSKNIL